MTVCEEGYVRLMEQSVLPETIAAVGSVRLQVENLQFLDNGPYSFSIKQGECVGLSGKSGVGKTQLLRAVTDLIPHGGRVLLDGADSSSFQAPIWRSQATMIPAESFWWYDFVGDHFPVSDGGDHLRKNCQLLGFSEDVLTWRISRLSTGEKQRLALLRGLVNSPSVLLLDEPCSGLDPAHTGLVESFVLDYRRRNKASVLWVSHDAEQLQRVTDRELIVEKQGLYEKTVTTFKAGNDSDKG